MRPYEILPIDMPRDFDPGPEFFYNNVIKAIIPDMIQMMHQGIPIDDNAVESLRAKIDEVQKSVYATLEKNSLVKQYQEFKRPENQKEHYDKCTQAVRDSSYYFTQYKPSDILHRTWVVNTYLKNLGKESDVKDKWSLADLKKYNVFLKSNFVTAIIEGRHLTSNTDVIKGMVALSEHKAELWNRPRYEKANLPVPLNPFNPNSSKQLKELFDMLNIPPIAFSKDTGEASWGREQIEVIRKTATDPDLVELLDSLIDNSYSAIIQNNFIKAFDTFTIDGVLHGNISIFGAKSFRNTSNSPNLLNAPSTGSIYAKPLKKCFVSGSPDFVVYTADLSALEDRVIANLSGDYNKQNIFKEGLDGHSLNAVGYYKDLVDSIIGLKPTLLASVKAFMELHQKEDKRISDLRQLSKGPTFKLAYGGFPDDHKGGVITQEIFDNYHNVLYPGITDYRENYVKRTARRNGYIHLGLGCRMYSGDAEENIRTLHNATVQFWSILTLIAINEFNHRIRSEGLQDWVQVNSTIYDSIYTRCHKDPEIIQWTNNNLIEVMTVQYLKDEAVHNEATGEIGLNWAELHKVPNNASIDQIKEVLAKFA
jgi:hypothetical protein